MIPLRDDLPAGRVPWLTAALIAVNLAAHLLRPEGAAAQIHLAQTHGLVPARLLSPAAWGALGPVDQLSPLLGHLFLHGGWLHLLGNLWFLWVFGRNVERRLGAGRLLLFYLGCGVAAGLAQVGSQAGSLVPLIGASGAIAGILGAYLVLFPRARVLTLAPLPLIALFEVPAWVFLGVWGALQLVRATASLGLHSEVGWWAHLGGFAVGALVAWGLRPRPRPLRGRRPARGLI